ncbi:sigma-70 family RNA polymerase sigma factor [Ravibacter arvi]|uniref:Sigma-70 family RNA polymerase sigma factor n=1 Tax=Ravibacter arvi TaxID=2051041 RepID=A0ABP8LWD3_9BACT
MELDEMIEGLKREDSNAMEQFYSCYGPLIKGICFRYAQDREQAEDMFHDTLIELFEKVKKYRSTGSFNRWLKTVTVRTLIDHINKSKRARQKLEESANAYYENLADEPARLDLSKLALSPEELITAISRLPRGFRIVFNLYVIDGYAHKDIAGMLKISESASRSQLARAKIALRKVIEEKMKTD